MDELVRDLPENARILDLGAGSGSFGYASTQARVFALDLAFPPRGQAAAGRIIADSKALALKDESLDVVVCNHTLEHFPEVAAAVSEINRVLKKKGHLWVSVPNGFSFDDRLYRFIFKGGGHVNRFSLQSILDAVESATQLRAVRYKKLYSGFVYLNPPLVEKLPYYPPRARVLALIPPKLLEYLLRWLNQAVRVADRYFSSNLSQYGWGLIFRRMDGTPPRTDADRLSQMPADINVCFSCGAGHPEQYLKQFVRRRWACAVYECPSCRKTNLFFTQ